MESLAASTLHLATTRSRHSATSPADECAHIGSRARVDVNDADVTSTRRESTCSDAAARTSSTPDDTCTGSNIDVYMYIYAKTSPVHEYVCLNPFGFKFHCVQIQPISLNDINSIKSSLFTRLISEIFIGLNSPTLVHVH